MYIKKIIKKNKGSKKEFIYHRLIESYRTDKGPRHRVILNLGTLTIPQDQWKLLANRIEEIINGQKQLFQTDEIVEKLANHYAGLIVQNRLQKTDEDSIQTEYPDYQNIDINSIETSNVRTIGAEHLTYSYFKKLGFDKIFKSLGFTDYEISIAVLLIIGRLVNPASELSTFEWGINISGLQELLNVTFSHYSLSSLYRTSDLIFKNKDKIENELLKNEKNLYNLRDKIILYDLTNTYFEGKRYNRNKITFGRSKEKRSDCRIITLGLVTDENGFVKRSDFFAGNVSEPGTLEGILNKLSTNRVDTVIIDAGIGTKENLRIIKDKGLNYLCVARGKPISDEENRDGLVIIKESEENTVEAKLYKEDGESILFCKSRTKMQKEKSMMEAFRIRFEKKLEELKKSIKTKRGIKRYEKVIERLGRIKERSHGIHRYYDIEIRKDGKNIVNEIVYKYNKIEEAEKRYSGSYYLRTSRTDLNEKEIWDLYITLTGIEDSFKSMKDELGLRPIFHRKDDRIEGHIFISVLAYRILNAIRYKLKEEKIFMFWRSIRKRLSTLVLATSSMKKEDGEVLYIRSSSKMEEFHKEIYNASGVNLKIFNKKITSM